MDDRRRPDLKRTIIRLIILVGVLLSVSLLLNNLFAAPQPQSERPPNVSTPQPTRQSGTSPLYSATWHEFRSEEGGFSISYPETWNPNTEHSENGGVIFQLKDPLPTQRELMIGVTVAPLSTGQDLRQIVDMKLAMIPEETRNVLEEKVGSIGGETAVEIAGREERFRLLEIVVVKDGVFFEFWTQPYDPEHPLFGQWVPEMEHIFREMSQSISFFQ